MNDLTHFDDAGNAIMVDVSDKLETQRTATAKGCIKMAKQTLDLIINNQIKKGDVLTIAQIAGIMGGKRTPDIIPLCHPLSLTSLKVNLAINMDNLCVDIEATAKLKGRTGVEMEALSAVSIAALCVYDMVKAVDKNMYISDIRLTYKAGGKSGIFRAG